jgi:hypothetical protein
VIESAPAGSAVVFKVATPLVFSVAVPMLLPDCMKVTMPVGTVVPDWLATDAVNAMLCPVVPEVGVALRVVVVPGKVEFGH